MLCDSEQSELTVGNFAHTPSRIILMVSTRRWRIRWISGRERAELEP